MVHCDWLMSMSISVRVLYFLWCATWIWPN